MLLEEEEMVVAVRALRGYENWTEPEQTRAITFDARTTPGIHAVLTTPKSLLIPDTRQFPDWQRPRGAKHIIN